MIVRLSIISKYSDRQKVKEYMTGLSITSMDLICLEMMFKSGCPNGSSYGMIKFLRKQDMRKNIIFSFSDFCPTFSMLEV